MVPGKSAVQIEILPVIGLGSQFWAGGFVWVRRRFCSGGRAFLHCRGGPRAWHERTHSLPKCSCAPDRVPCRTPTASSAHPLRHADWGRRPIEHAPSFDFAIAAKALRGPRFQATCRPFRARVQRGVGARRVQSTRPMLLPITAPVEGKHYVAHFADADHHSSKYVNVDVSPVGLHRCRCSHTGTGAPLDLVARQGTLHEGQGNVPTLDYYHVAEHLANLGKVLFGSEAQDANNWSKGNARATRQ